MKFTRNFERYSQFLGKPVFVSKIGLVTVTELCDNIVIESTQTTWHCVRYSGVHRGPEPPEALVIVFSVMFQTIDYQ